MFYRNIAMDMGSTKTSLFDFEQNYIAQICKALAHPARIAIIEHLHRSKTCINNDLVNELGLAQATVSQHLKELKNLGLIQGTIEGSRICYCIDQEKWSEVSQALHNLFNQDQAFKTTENCC